METRMGAQSSGNRAERARLVLLRKAESVFGNSAKARRWLGAYSAVLGATPLALSSSKQGRRLVYDELTRIDHGNFT
ncbi:antitoxin Xre/MbcA/ParS toxin-binding domain-containing protein [Lysobacter changpingensis]|uniref:antitoxin Xre/MbcA/ParS toxin-binding domain-containing protein n=1 Tax=Lysobacter changpingensis TaxID=2792784 RepID=UPI003CCD5FB8